MESGEGPCSFTGHPHLPGTKEYLFTLKSVVGVFLRGKTYPVNAGDMFAFEGDQNILIKMLTPIKP